MRAQERPDLIQGPIGEVPTITRENEQRETARSEVRKRRDVVFARFPESLEIIASPQSSIGSGLRSHAEKVHTTGDVDFIARDPCRHRPRQRCLHRRWGHEFPEIGV
ncbi:hypothetical protein L484_016135 [Morus notabilis]|uniref:Uncharacterized protein n=1 Tax=Morus notabilis TaxID=981085 RepID=W9QWH9_9ROSA|nr:hypothetical protein L484_016135 [Morus notabilis]